jgi:hypothetical protein
VNPGSLPRLRDGLVQHLANPHAAVRTKTRAGNQEALELERGSPARSNRALHQPTTETAYTTEPPTHHVSGVPLSLPCQRQNAWSTKSSKAGTCNFPNRCAASVSPPRVKTNSNSSFEP